VQNTRGDWGLHYELVADPKNLLCKKYSMGVMKQSSHKWARFVTLLTEYKKGVKQNIPEYDDGVALPGVLVMKQDGSILYKWVAQPKETNFMGGFNRVNPADVLEIVKFYFANPTIVDSVKAYVVNNMYDTFILVLGDPEGKILFRNHLRKEFNEEALEFITDVEQLKQKQGNSENLYVTYIPGGAPKEINLPGAIRKQVYNTYKSKGYDAFEPAYEHIKFSLSEDSFNRFVNTEEFIKLATKIIPQVFTSEATDDVCVLRK
jgi:hypothetical protein